MRKQIRNQKAPEEGGYVKAIVYDLPSENRIVFSDRSLKNLVRTTRVLSVQKLHDLGLQCTESVILIPRENVVRIEETIREVNELYERLNSTLRENGVSEELKPIIRVIDLSRTQFQNLRDIVERRLIESLDRAIDVVNRTLEEINEELEERARRRIAQRLYRLRREWRRIFMNAQRLGIDISSDYEYLISLIDEGLRSL